LTSSESEHKDYATYNMSIQYNQIIHIEQISRRSILLYNYIVQPTYPTVRLLFKNKEEKKSKL